MKKIFYTAPEVMAYEVVAERGYQASGLESSGLELGNMPSEKDSTGWN